MGCVDASTDIGNKNGTTILPFSRKDASVTPLVLKRVLSQSRVFRVRGSEYVCSYVKECVYVCVCVREREKECEREI